MDTTCYLTSVMGLIFSSFVSKFFGKKQVRILMVGLDAAGKTTILYKMKLGQVVQTMPTIGFNVETVEYKNICFTVWDVGGQDKLRRLWRHYFQNSQGLIFVVDSSDRDRIEQCAGILKSLICEYNLENVVLLVFANKQDVPSAMTTSELAIKLKLSEIKDRKCHIQGTCGLTGAGLMEGLEWLAKEINNN